MNWKNYAIALGSTIYSGAVLAQTTSGTHGPGWESIAIGAVGLLLASVGWYAKGISGRVDRLDNRVTDLNNAMLRDYHPKQDVNEALKEIKASVRSLHERFDKFEQLYGR